MIILSRPNERGVWIVSSELTMHEVFEKAAQTVRYGWQQKDWYSDDGKKKCMIQAVMSELGIDGPQMPRALPVPYLRVIDGVLNEQRQYRRIRKCHAKKSDKSMSHATVIRRSIIDWNDADNRRQHQVVEALMAAAKGSERYWWRRQNRLLAANDPTGSGFVQRPIEPANLPDAV